MIKRWNQFINESVTSLNELDELSDLIDTQISLVKTLHTTGKYNQETREMDKVKSSRIVNGAIGEIGVYDGDFSPGFFLNDEHGKKLGFVMYDKKNDRFEEGESSLLYTYTGQTESDNQILQKIKNQFNS